MITLAEEEEVHPSELVTVKVNVPDVSPVTVVLEPVPDNDPPPGLVISVQVPEEGRLLRTTLPVGEGQLGWVIKPTAGAGGVCGWEVITMFPDGTDTHPFVFVTVNE